MDANQVKQACKLIAACVNAKRQTPENKRYQAAQEAAISADVLRLRRFAAHKPESAVAANVNGIADSYLAQLKAARKGQTL